MPILVPPILDPVESPSPGEQVLFERFLSEPGMDDWIVIHSLNIARHVRQVEGEADFVILIPERGIVVLEVKACERVERQSDGMWRLGQQPAKRRSPFQQATGALHSIRKFLIEKSRRFEDILFVSAVAFTHLDVRLDSNEWESWQWLDAKRLRAPLAEVMGSLLDNMDAKLARHHKLHQRVREYGFPQHECARVREYLIPSGQLKPSYHHKKSLLDEALDNATNRQRDILQSQRNQKRLIVEGPAGTGKTLLAIARVESELGREGGDDPYFGPKVLLACHNRGLGQFLSNSTEDLSDRLTCGTLSKIMMEVAGISPKGGETSNWYSHVLPDCAIERVIETGPMFDTIVIDEAQDILSSNGYDFLDLALEGGWKSGRWSIFGDFVGQNIYGNALNDRLELLRTLQTGSAELNENCRNIPKIGKFAATMGGLNPGYDRFLLPDQGKMPQVAYYEDHSQQSGILDRIIRRLRSEEGYKPQDIVILSFCSRNESIANEIRTVGDWGRRIAPYTPNEENRIRFASIHEFKGLEARAVIVTDISDVDAPFAKERLYVGFSRAIERLELLVQRDSQAALLNYIGGM